MMLLLRLANVRTFVGEMLSATAVVAVLSGVWGAIFFTLTVVFGQMTPWQAITGVSALSLTMSAVVGALTSGVVLPEIAGAIRGMAVNGLVVILGGYVVLSVSPKLPIPLHPSSLYFSAGKQLMFLGSAMLIGSLIGLGEREKRSTQQCKCSNG
jgi:hypothetical protein